MKEADAILRLSMYNKNEFVLRRLLRGFTGTGLILRMDGNVRIRRWDRDDIWNDYITHNCRSGQRTGSGVSVPREPRGSYACFHLSAHIRAVRSGDGGAAVLDRRDRGSGNRVVWHHAGSDAAGAAEGLWKSMSGKCDAAVISNRGISSDCGRGVYFR